MISFKLNDMEFGISEKETKIVMTDDVLQIDIYGESLPVDTLLIDRKLDWIIYPPIFRLKCHPLKMKSFNEKFELNFGENELDEIDSSFVLMEHWDVDQVKISMDMQAGFISIDGIALIDGGFPFSIKAKL